MPASGRVTKTATRPPRVFVDVNNVVWVGNRRAVGRHRHLADGAGDGPGEGLRSGRQTALTVHVRPTPPRACRRCSIDFLDGFPRLTHAMHRCRRRFYVDFIYIVTQRVLRDVSPSEIFATPTKLT